MRQKLVLGLFLRFLRIVARGFLRMRFLEVCDVVDTNKTSVYWINYFLRVPRLSRFAVKGERSPLFQKWQHVTE